MADLSMLRARVQELEEQVRQMRALLAGPRGHFPLAWRLTCSEAKLLAALARTGEAAYEVLRTVFDRDDDAVRTLVRRLRAKAAPRGVTILSRSGWGYALTPEALVCVRAALACGPLKTNCLQPRDPALGV